MRFMKTNIMVVKVVNFENLQQDLWWYYKWVDEIFIISTTQFFLLTNRFFGKVEQYETFDKKTFFSLNRRMVFTLQCIRQD